MTTDEQILAILADGGKHSGISLVELTGKSQGVVSKWCRRLRDEGIIDCCSDPDSKRGGAKLWFLVTGDNPERDLQTPLARVRYGSWV
ncbi:winged helix-turn-helix transcriptional regulator [Litorivivens sp.]|uniref:winged helix-turn-helix transcriptional regulator n=1 Tax=Litorivivens sp. TaxID=2020868 RepID=UPI003562040B